MLWSTNDYTTIDVSDVSIKGNVIPKLELDGETRFPLRREDVAFVMEFIATVFGEVYTSGYPVPKYLWQFGSIKNQHSVVANFIDQVRYHIYPDTYSRTGRMFLPSMPSISGFNQTYRFQNYNAVLSFFGQDWSGLKTQEEGYIPPRHLSLDMMRRIYHDINMFRHPMVFQIDDLRWTGTWEEGYTKTGITDSGVITKDNCLTYDGIYRVHSGRYHETRGYRYNDIRIDNVFFDMSSSGHTAKYYLPKCKSGKVCVCFCGENSGDANTKYIGYWMDVIREDDEFGGYVYKLDKTKFSFDFLYTTVAERLGIDMLPSSGFASVRIFGAYFFVGTYDDDIVKAETASLGWHY